MIPVRCVVFISGVDEVFRTFILPAMAAHFYLFYHPFRWLIPLRLWVLQEPHSHTLLGDSFVEHDDVGANTRKEGLCIREIWQCAQSFSVQYGKNQCFSSIAAGGENTVQKHYA
jgi:hypothetical protein